MLSTVNLKKKKSPLPSGLNLTVPKIARGKRFLLTDESSAFHREKKQVYVFTVVAFFWGEKGESVNLSPYGEFDGCPRNLKQRCREEEEAMLL